MKKLWVEQYRPNTVDGYVFTDESQRQQMGDSAYAFFLQHQGATSRTMDVLKPFIH